MSNLQKGDEELLLIGFIPYKLLIYGALGLV